MTAGRTWATARRVVHSFDTTRGRSRSSLVVPCVLQILVHALFADSPQIFQKLGVPAPRPLPLRCDVPRHLDHHAPRAALRDTRAPSHDSDCARDLLVGYGTSFAALAAIQATLVSALSFGLLGLDAGHSVVAVVAIAIANAVLGMSLGLFASAFARTEFQAVQFMPAFVLPQILLCGLIVPRDQMAGWLQAISAVLPFTYAYDALAKLASSTPLGARFWVDVVVIVGVTVLSLGLGAATLRRPTA